MYGCADLALLSEGCIRVACRKGHRTTVVLQKKKRAAEPSESEFSHGDGKGWRKGGGGVQGKGEQCMEIIAELGENGREIDGEVEKNCTHTNTHNTQTPTPPLHCSSKTDNRPPSLRCLSEPPKLVPMDFCISVLQQWANYHQAPSPN